MVAWRQTRLLHGLLRAKPQGVLFKRFRDSLPFRASVFGQSIHPTARVKFSGSNIYSDDESNIYSDNVIVAAPREGGDDAGQRYCN